MFSFSLVCVNGKLRGTQRWSGLMGGEKKFSTCNGNRIPNHPARSPVTMSITLSRLKQQLILIDRCQDNESGLQYRTCRKQKNEHS